MPITHTYDVPDDPTVIVLEEDTTKHLIGRLARLNLINEEENVSVYSLLTSNELRTVAALMVNLANDLDKD